MNNSMFVNPGKPSPMMGHSVDMAGGGFAPKSFDWGGMMSVAGDALGGFAPGMGQRPEWQGFGNRPGLFGGQFGQFQRQQPMGFSPQGGFGGGGYQADPFAFAPMPHDPRMNGFAR